MKQDAGDCCDGCCHDDKHDECGSRSCRDSDDEENKKERKIRKKCVHLTGKKSYCAASLARSSLPWGQYEHVETLGERERFELPSETGYHTFKVLHHVILDSTRQEDFRTANSISNSRWSAPTQNKLTCLFPTWSFGANLVKVGHREIPNVHSRPGTPGVYRDVIADLMDGVGE
eukprot:760544-Hanusia_phi.AAC.1